jgi:hypothetical protein
MATRALSIVASALNSAGNATTAPDWTTHPVVRRILASFATNPAPVVDLPRHQQWGGNCTAYAGFRVECLRILRRSLVDAAFLAAEARGDMDTARALAAAPSVSDAIDAARRIQPLPVVTTGIRQLDPAIWGVAL